jgi:IS5 family transposase
MFLGMQGERPRALAGPDVWETCRELIPAGSVFAFLAGHRDALFPAGMFADMYPSPNGRPSVPPQVLAVVVVLQALHGLPDYEAAQAVRCDLRWKAACGLGLLDSGFDSSLLTYFRRRLQRSGDPGRLFAKVGEVAAATGVLAGKRRRALDSTVLDDAVATQDTVTRLVAAIRRVIREVPGGPEAAASACTAHDYRDPGKPKIAWDDEEARTALVSALVNDALALLGSLPAQPGGPAADAVGLLALVAGQDVEPAEGSDGTDGRWRIARRTAPGRLVSVTDPDARHVHKNRTRRQDGFKARVSFEPETGLFTAVELTGGSGAGNHEASVAVRLLACEAAGVTVPGDAAYGTGELRAHLQDAGHATVIKPPPPRPAVPGGFTG